MNPWDQPLYVCIADFEAFYKQGLISKEYYETEMKRLRHEEKAVEES